MRLVNPAEVLERYNWYMDVMENEPDSALSKALDEATDYNDRPTDSITITLTMEQWETVRHWLTYGGDYHRGKMEQWLANCADRKMAAELAAEHEKAAIAAETMRKIIEAELCPQSPTETE